jgi:capsular polysaccharide biosynthesis protein
VRHQERPGERFPQRIAQAVLKRLWVVLLVVGFVGPTLGFSLLQPTVYEASALLLLEENWESDRSGIRLIPLYFPGAAERAVEALDNPAIAKEAIRLLGLSGIEPGELLDNLTTTQEPGTLFIELSYKDANPQRAKRIANTVAEVASERISQETPYEYVLRFRVWEEALLPPNPLSPNSVRNAALALTLGLAVGIGLALLMDKRSQT